MCTILAECSFYGTIISSEAQCKQTETRVRPSSVALPFLQLRNWLYLQLLILICFTYLWLSIFSKQFPPLSFCKRRRVFGTYWEIGTEYWYYTHYVYVYRLNIDIIHIMFMSITHILSVTIERWGCWAAGSNIAKRIFGFFLGWFEKLIKMIISFVRSAYLSVCLCLSVCLSVCPLEQLGYHWKDFHEIWYLSVFRKYFDKLQFSLNPTGTVHKYLHIFMTTSWWIILRWEIFQAKFLEQPKHTFYDL